MTIDEKLAHRVEVAEAHKRGVAEERERIVHLLAKQREKYSSGTRLQLAMTTAIGAIFATPIRAAQDGESDGR